MTRPGRTNRGRPGAFRRRVASVAAPLALAVLPAGALGAQTPVQTPVAADATTHNAVAQRAEPPNQLTLDATVLGGSIAYARRTGPGAYLGFAAGVGGDFLSAMLIGGSHFAEDWGISYEPKDGAGGELLFEILHLALFRRQTLGSGWETDYGARASVFFHYDDSDDDPGGGLFGGAYAAFLWGGRHLRVGPRVMAGVFDDAVANEFGVLLNPITLRLTLPW